MKTLDAALNRARSGGFVLFADQAAAMLAEVERLRAVNAQLLAALKLAELWVCSAEGDAEYPAVQQGAMRKVRAAIKAAEGDA